MFSFYYSITIIETTIAASHKLFVFIDVQQIFAYLNESTWFLFWACKHINSNMSEFVKL